MFLQELLDNTFLNGAPGFLGNVDMLKKLMYGSQNDLVNPPLEATPSPQEPTMQDDEAGNEMGSLQKMQMLQELLGDQQQEQAQQLQNNMPSPPPMIPQQQYAPLLSGQKDAAYGLGKTMPKISPFRRRFGGMYGSF